MRERASLTAGGGGQMAPPVRQAERGAHACGGSPGSVRPVHLIGSLFSSYYSYAGHLA